MANKVEFAHALRGVAALSVMIAHYCGTFFQHHPAIAALLLVPSLPLVPEVSGIAAIAGRFGIVLSQFGVGVFFIISGFVIPFSMTSGNGHNFVLRRVFRIFPVYIAGFSAVALSIWLLTRSYGTPFDYSLGHLASHFGIISRGLLGYSRIDGISWTLEVELWFYVAMAIGGFWLFRSGPKAFYVATVFIALLSIVSTHLLRTGHYNLVGGTGFQLWASMLLILGLAYHALFRAQVTVPQFCRIHVAIAALMGTVWLFSDRSVYHWQWPAGYLLAMLVFATGYVCRSHIRAGPVLSHLADISYPLYVVHALMGYAIMYVLIGTGYGPHAAILIAMMTSYCVAVVLHYAVEKPFIRLGRAATSPSKARSAPSRARS
ncbi:acyltransferase family protein [Neorhizobium sp. NPDC001467]|uniref:acyltransferase family protein n=1 Tax=Neorhizobium sp. NPDC001467 TaxID=3390595 RepID=UPI003CFFDE99